ncbi:MAG: carboxypeptidase-like regulatory domain-containing protein [Chitinophagaceae bacterium]
MANKPDIKKYTAADIEKYHRGQLTSTEKNALEKAALEDPFLADALEGYAFAGNDLAGDLSDLRNRLSARTGSAGNSSIPSGKSRFSPMMRAAAMILLLATAGLLVYQFAFNRKEQGLAESRPPTALKNQAPVSDSLAMPPAEAARQTELTSMADSQLAGQTRSIPKKPVAGNAPETTNKEVASDKASLKKEDQTGSIEEQKAIPAGEVSVPAPSSKPVVVSASQQPAPPPGAVNKESSRKAENAKALSAKQTNRDKDMSAGNVVSAQQPDDQVYRNRALNTFRGRVTDGSNEGLPFANLAGTGENKATYTDANGNFVITSPDTVLRVQVRSQGYDDNTVQLRNDLASNHVVMQEDTRKQSDLSARSRNLNTESGPGGTKREPGEPTPLAGWEKYDSYLANNLNYPAGFKSGSAGNGIVELSLEVDKSGRPNKIKIEKSLCPVCDQEAIRLVKEGPNWKRGSDKNSRTRLIINF